MDQVDVVINSDARTTPSTFLGWPRDRIFHDVLGWGQADFDAPIGHLSGEDRALLYARYNQPGHIDELCHAFGTLFEASELVGRPTILDLGCGPFTAGLALAAVLGSHRPFRYYGVDRSRAMLQLGRVFAEDARFRGALDPSTTYDFVDGMDKLEVGPIRADLTLVVASYLLASPTLDVDTLVREIMLTLVRIGPGPAAVLYTNSADPRARAQFPTFRDQLCSGGFQARVDEEERFEGTRRPRRLHYALFFRPANVAIDL
ncbi:MAG: class I SAM-dependent methyltransferase [Myxococcota bacterium]